MTIDPFPCYERDVHVNPEKSFYAVNIPNSHNQLRHLICSPTSNQIYYVDGTDVWRLDPSRSKRTHVTELSFNPSCLAAAHGWFCVGGHQNGHFFFIRLPESSPPGSNSASDLFNSSTHGPVQSNHEQLGSAITNSVSIHRLPRLRSHAGDEDYAIGDADDDVEDDEAEDTVALITNNDNTVRLFSLEHRTELTRLQFEYPMNHATISPDGSLMIIVGDEQFAFIYERAPAGTTNTSDNVRFSGSQWLFLRKLGLYKPPKAKTSGYFTTAWSYSGALCATASELGYVTVFDAARLRQPDLDPVVAVVPSSRPLTTPGAIRSMSFAPEPLDLLFWTENMGRMCVADLRSGLRARQVVHLDPKAPGVTQVDTIKVNRSLDDPELHDFDMEIDFIRRQQQSLTDTETAARDMSLATEYLEASAERRRLQREGMMTPPPGDEDQGLTEQERQVIQGIRTGRQIQQQLNEDRQRAARQAGSVASESAATGTPASAAASSGPNRRPSPQSYNYTIPPGRRRHQMDSLLDSTDELGRDHANSHLGSIRDYLNSRLDESSRMDALSAIAQHRIRRLEGSSSSVSSSRPSSSNPPTNNNPTDPWRTIEAAMRAPALSALTNPASTSTSSSNRNNQQQAHDSDSDSMHELERTHSNASNNAPAGRTTSTRATLPSLRGSSAAYLDSERRRIQEFGTSASELTTRGQALYARQREADRQRGDEAPESGWRASATPTGRGGLDANLLRRMAAGTRTMMSGSPPFYFSPDGLRRNMPSSTDGVDDSNAPESTWGLGTTGICWGNGGRLLYVGTEDGIFELKINLHERNFWPAITPR